MREGLKGEGGYRLSSRAVAAAKTKVKKTAAKHVKPVQPASLLTCSNKFLHRYMNAGLLMQLLCM